MAAPSTVGRDRRTREPAVVRPGPNSRVRSRVRVQWLVLAAALTVLAGVVVAWALTRAADRVAVLSVAQPVAAGETIEASDLVPTDIAFESRINGLVPAASLDRLVGRVATIDLVPGVLLTTGMWEDAPELAANERSVGASLAVGRHPAGLTRGSRATAIAVESTATADGGGDLAPVAVRMLEVVVADDGALEVTLAVPETDAAAVARLAATGRLALLGVPQQIESVPESLPESVPEPESAP